jgi:hypothetical protein
MLDISDQRLLSRRSVWNFDPHPSTTHFSIPDAWTAAWSDWVMCDDRRDSGVPIWFGVEPLTNAFNFKIMVKPVKRINKSQNNLEAFIKLIWNRYLLSKQFSFFIIFIHGNLYFFSFLAQFFILMTDDLSHFGSEKHFITWAIPCQFKPDHYHFTVFQRKNFFQTFVRFFYAE